MKGLTDVPGILVGHVSDYGGLTGCTAILCEAGAVGGADIRGSATGTQEFGLFNPLHVSDRVNALVFAGGSAFGLEAASGVRRFLAHKGVGFAFGGQHVPLVPAAILFDLGFSKPGVRPTREMGESAAAAATDHAVMEGAVGAATGATVGKIYGLKQAMKSGIGSYTVRLDNDVIVSALAAVNAFGDVVDPRSGKIVAGARASASSREFVNTAERMKAGARISESKGQNTTLVVVATNALLTKPESNKLAEFGSLGVARTVSPVWTLYDGDLVVALSCGEKSADLNVLGVAAAEAVSQSILRAVRLAPTLGGLPGLKG